MYEKQVAKTIVEQLGGKALYLIGAKNLVSLTVEGKPGVMMNIMRSGKELGQSINWMQILLDEGKDMYEMTFGWRTSKGVKVVAEHTGVFCDQLHEMIWETTGLVTDFPTVRMA